MVKLDLSSQKVAIHESYLDIGYVTEVLSTSGMLSKLNKKYGRLLKLVDRTDLGSVGDEP